MEKVEEENCRHKDEIRDVNEQLKALQLARDGLEAELEEKQRHWAQEKQRMEVDLSRMLETHQPNNSQSEVSKWRSIAEASKIETARAKAVLESHRKGEEEATKEVESLRERLATSLANYVAIVQEKNDLEKTLDHVKVDLQRARRKVDALESRDRYRTLRSSSEPFENTNPDSDIQPTAEFTDR